MGHSEAAAREKPICPTRLWCNPQSTNAPPRRDLGGKVTCLDVPLAYVYRSALLREHWRPVLSKPENFFEVRKDMGPAWWATGFVFTDQLMTPYFSGASTLNGTPGGDRWARILGGLIG